MSDHTEHLISMAGGDGEDEDEAALLARCNRTRRRRKCIAAGDHPDPAPAGTEPAKCPRCGL